eukprot:gene2381-4625_t
MSYLHKNAWKLVPDVGDVQKHAIHKVVFAVKQRNIELLESLFIDISNPFSVKYRNFLSRDEIAKISANPEGTSTVLNFLHSIPDVSIVQQSKYGDFITVTAPVRTWEELLDASFVPWRATINGNTKTVFRSHNHKIPDILKEHVSEIFHVSHLPTVARNTQVVNLVPINGSSLFDKIDSGSFITPSKLGQFYNIPTKTGSKLASQSVFETTGQYFSSSDLHQFQDLFQLSRDDVSLVIGKRDNDQRCRISPIDCVEANLDVQYMMSISKHTSTSLWYVEETDDVFVEWILAVNDMDHPPLVHSISFGSYEDAMVPAILAAFDVEAMKLGLLGVTIVAASGDDGVGGYLVRFTDSFCGYYPTFPASSPYVVSVGGTMWLDIDENEVACQSDAGGVITSGGGFSHVYPTPSWQKAAIDSYFESLPSTITPVPGYSTSGRGYPDVSLAALNYPVVVGGEMYVVSGTSASSPVVAAMISIVNAELLAAGKPPVGFINPTMYANHGAFANDIKEGDNHCSSYYCCSEGFSARPGWDPVTGFGSVDFQRLRGLLASPSSPSSSSATSTLRTSHSSSSSSSSMSSFRSVTDTGLRLLGALALVFLIVGSILLAVYMLVRLLNLRSRGGYRVIRGGGGGGDAKTVSSCSSSPRSPTPIEFTKGVVREDKSDI